MKNVSTLNALPRKKVGTNSAKKVREKDQIPAIIYGDGVLSNSALTPTFVIFLTLHCKTKSLLGIATKHSYTTLNFNLSEIIVGMDIVIICILLTLIYPSSMHLPSFNFNIFKINE